jgi:hypothetical protein
MTLFIAPPYKARYARKTRYRHRPFKSRLNDALAFGNLGFQGDLIPVLAKHTGSVNLADLISEAIDQIQQQFDPLPKQVDRWQYTPLSQDDARLAIYWAFREGKIKMTMKLMIHSSDGSLHAALRSESAPANKPLSAYHRCNPSSPKSS